MSNIDRTLHGDTDLNKASVLETSDVRILNSIGVPLVNNKLSNSTILSATKLKLLQESTMIESALDLDALEEQSVASINSGNSSQTGLLKCNPNTVYQ